MLSGGCAGGAVLATGSFVRHENVAGDQWCLGRETLHRSKRPFSESVEMVVFIAEPSALRTPKRIRTLTTPASHVSRATKKHRDHHTVQMFKNIRERHNSGRHIDAGDTHQLHDGRGK